MAGKAPKGAKTDKTGNKKDRLNPMQELFCYEYTVDYNATAAATRAGYSKNTAAAQGSRLLKDVNILSRVRHIQSERLKKLSLNGDFVLLKLIEVYNKCMIETPIMRWNSDEHKYVESDEYTTFDSKGALKALELLGKHLAMFTQKIEHSGEINTGNEELKSILDQLKGRASDEK